MSEKYAPVSSSDSESTLLRSSGEDDPDTAGTAAGHARWRRDGTPQKTRRGLSAAAVSRALGAVLALLCVGSFVYMSRELHGISTGISTGISAAAAGAEASRVVHYGDCGVTDSVEEARAKGCVFDPMGWIWTRPECYDAELVADFMNRTEWSWHTDPKLTEASRVPMDAIFRGDHPKLFTSKKYHYVHCTYMWKKMHKALVHHRPIDSYLTDFTHTHHCEMVLLNDYLHEDVQCTAEMVCPTWVRATWTSCSTL